MREPRSAEPTIDWMSADAAQRCRTALEVIESDEPKASDLEAAAAALRSVADDVLAIVELLDGHGSQVRSSVVEADPGSFGLALGSALRSSDRT